MGTYRVIEVVEARPRAVELAPTPLTLGLIAVGSALAYWAMGEEANRINMKLMSLLEKHTTGRWTAEDRKKLAADVKEIVETPYLSDQAKRAVVSVASAFRVPFPSVEAFRVQMTPELPTEIMGVPVGTPSKVSKDVPPVGAVLAMTDVLEGEYLGGHKVTYSPRGPREYRENEVEVLPRHTPDPKDVEIIHQVLTGLVSEIGDKFPDLRYGGNIVTDVGLTESLLNQAAREYGQKHELDLIDAMAQIKKTGLVDEPEMYEKYWSSTIEHQLVDYVIESFEEMRIPHEYDTIKGSDGTEYRWKLLLDWGPYQGLNLPMFITNTSTQRGYAVHDVHDAFVNYLKEGVVSAKDLDIKDTYLQPHIDKQNKVDREVAVATSQFIHWEEEAPGYEMAMTDESGDYQRGCMAWECYPYRRSIMDPQIPINAVDCDPTDLDEKDVDECGVSPDTYSDQCCEMKNAVEAASSLKLEQRTWTEGSPWFVDLCGIHIEIDGEWYTVPPDNIVEYKHSSQLTPKYLPGLVCAAFAVVTPETQKEMEATLVGEQERLAKIEPGVITGAMLSLYKEQDQEDIVKFVEAAQSQSIAEAFKRGVKERWFDFMHWMLPVKVSDAEYTVRTEYNRELDTLKIEWEEGQKIDRGKYVVDGPSLARYLYDVAQGRPRNSIMFRSL